MILIHVFVAISAVGLSGLTLLYPSKPKLYLSYFLTIGTLATGGYLVVTNKDNLVSACIAGLIFLTLVGSMLLLASQKLSRRSLNS